MLPWDISPILNVIVIQKIHLSTVKEKLDQCFMKEAEKLMSQNFTTKMIESGLILLL